MSAWGLSWGLYWGVSWGTPAAVVIAFPLNRTTRIGKLERTVIA